VEQPAEMNINQSHTIHSGRFTLTLYRKAVIGQQPPIDTDVKLRFIADDGITLISQSLKVSHAL